MSGGCFKNGVFLFNFVEALVYVVVLVLGTRVNEVRLEKNVVN